VITTPSFIDLHTHTRYPDLNNFQYQEIENSAKFGGYSDLLAMANSEVAIDNLHYLNH
jgi:dihydroorotase-like cyclic amidohydrolase